MVVELGTGGGTFVMLVVLWGLRVTMELGGVTVNGVIQKVSKFLAATEAEIPGLGQEDDDMVSGTRIAWIDDF